MDALARLTPVAEVLLTEVDRVLARFGAPDGHAIWPLLRRGGLLPTDALAGAASWSPTDLTARAEILMRQGDQHELVAAALADPAGWEGHAAAAFSGRLALARAEASAIESGGRTLAACLLDLADWSVSARHRLARGLANVMYSAEAVTMTTWPASSLLRQADVARAAASIGVSVLTDVDIFWTGALEIAQRHRLHIDPVRVDGREGGSSTLRATY